MRRPQWNDERGEMIVVMFGITALLLGITGVLVTMAGRPAPDAPAAAARDAAMAAAVEIRTQALHSGLRAADLGSPRQVDIGAACDRAERAVGASARVVECGLTSEGITVLAGRADDAVADNGQSFASATVGFVDSTGSCLALRTSWAAALPALCPADGK